MPNQYTQRELDNILRYKEYLDLAATMIIDLDLEGRVRFANKHACTILEVQEDEIVGKDWIDHYIPQRMMYSARYFLSGDEISCVTFEFSRES